MIELLFFTVPAMQHFNSFSVPKIPLLLDKDINTGL